RLTHPARTTARRCRAIPEPSLAKRKTGSLIAPRSWIGCVPYSTPPTSYRYWPPLWLFTQSQYSAGTTILHFSLAAASGTGVGVGGTTISVWRSLGGGSVSGAG